ncbi:MAG: hypothetical protein H0V22_10485 [Solirubrobacterales bacterium]|nr:hypothetical protein [Solirubrobacterales bacterium]
MRTLTRRTIGWLTLTLALALTLFAALASAGSEPHAGLRVDMRVLLLSADGGEPDYQSWKAELRREGVPFDTIVGTSASDPDITASTLADGDHAKYEGVIVASADGTLSGGRPISFASGSGVAAFSEDEWATLKNFERKFAVRHLIANAYPGPTVGLTFSSGAGPLDGKTFTLNAAGLQAFPYLKGPVSFDTGTFASFAKPCPTADENCSAASFTPLLQDSSGATLLGTDTTKDGREEMVATFNGNPNQLHTGLLRHGMLSWVTRGIYLGRDRAYLSVNVDDVLLPDDKWDPVSNTTPEDTAPGQQDLRMTAADVTRLVNWQNANGFRLDMLFNGGGSVDAGASDPLTSAFLKKKQQFRWVNHTFGHPNIDGPPTLTLAEIVATIRDNQQWATRNKLPNFDRSELVTGEHSGIGTTNPYKAPNPNMALALSDTGILSLGSDNSREDGQRAIGTALTFPRYPMNVFYNVATFADQLDEYNWLYLAQGSPGGNCTNTATTTCFTTPTTKEQFVDREASGIIRHMLGNDPRPHYAHQSNLISDPTNTNPANRGDGILFAVLTEALKRYRTYVAADFVRATPTQATEELRRQAAWNAALADGKVSGYIQDGRVTITAAPGATVLVPVTGTSSGTLYGGQRSDWVSVAGGSSAVLAPDNPANTAAPTISGDPHPGGTLTATNGSWTGNPTLAKQWQSGRSGTWSDIPGATADTYTVTDAEADKNYRVVVTAGNSISSWSMAFSNVLADTPVNTAPPVISGSPVVGSVLQASTGTWTSPGPSYDYQWERSSDIGATWSVISGATASSYTPDTGDVGYKLRVRVTTANDVGSQSAYSAAVGPVSL